MNSPELPTPQEQKTIDRMIETTIDFMVEREHIHEVPRICEGNETGEE